jgi:IS605 OrfB family transposase
MKLTAVVKLVPLDPQRPLLYATLEQANAACNVISETAWTRQKFSRVPLHRLVYAPVRAAYPLAAQIVVRCTGKVVEAYKADRKTRRQFRKLGAISYDDRILNWHLADHQVSIWLLGGRQMISFVTGKHQWALLAYQQGESDLVYRKGEFYLHTTCDVPEDAPLDPEAWLGVDLGIANIAADSDGEFYQGRTVQKVRFRRRRLRTKLQRKGTLGTHRRLRQLSGQERRFATQVNHTISKRLVHKAQGTGRGIALEELGGIRARITVSKSQRAGLHSWSFFQLRQFVEYKAQRAGVPVVAVDPHHTSRTCPVCGCIDPHNRPIQSTFSCVQCGFAAHADHVAAVNISRRAAVNRPDCSEACMSAAPEQSPRL